jgi:hypothetical protein
MQVDHRLLSQSQAGMRLIAQATIYNKADFDRLTAYIRENYAPAALEDGSADERLRFFRDTHTALGRLKVLHVVSAEKHHVVVVMEAERGDDYFVNDLEVEEDYPHRITYFDHYRVDVEFN